MAASGGARGFLTRTKLADVTGGKHSDVVVLREDSTIDLALRTLAANRILSAPVVSASKGDVLEFIDLYGILKAFTEELDFKELHSMKMLQRLRVLEKKGQEFAIRSIKSLMGPTRGSTDGDFLHKGAAEHATLREIIHNEFLYPCETKALHGGSHTSPRQHRVALFDKEGKLTNIISQSDIVRFLAAHTDQLGALASQTVEQLGWAAKPLISVTPDVPAIEAMELMVEKGISAVAVVAADGRLIGNFSVSELRTIMSEHFGSLALPVGEFLALEHGTEYEGYTMRSDSETREVEGTPGVQFAQAREGRARPHTPGQEVGQSLVVVSRTATLGEVLQLLVKHRIHRIYVSDEAGRGASIVTLTDVLTLVVQTDE